MARTIYTERDIEDLAQRGVKELDVNEDVYFTDLAREKMDQLGIKPRRSGASRASTGAAQGAQAGGGAGPLTESERQQVFEKVKSGVIARLGPGVDTRMVDTIVRRVVNQL